MVAAGRLAVLQRDFEAGVAWLQRSLELYEALGDRAGICDALSGLAVVGQEQDDMSVAQATQRALPGHGSRVGRCHTRAMCQRCGGLALASSAWPW